MSNINNINVNISSENLIEVVGNVTSPFVVLSELVKNGVDANASSITIRINTDNNTISVIDNGYGFWKEDIEDLGKVAISKKKQIDFTNDEGRTLLGSKGLAIFSVFSLGNKVSIRTTNKDSENFFVKWNKETGIISYEEINDYRETMGTEIVISEVNNETMLLLKSQKEIEKFKHISLLNYKKDINLPKVIVFIDDDIVNTGAICNIEDFKNDFDTIVQFKYQNNNEKVKFKYITEDPRVYDKEVVFDLLNNIEEQIEQNYRFKPEGLSFDDYTTGGELVKNNQIILPEFEGSFYVKNNRKNIKMKEFGFGVRVYINDFALYNYLNVNNDWLNLSDISGNKKSNSFKKHNVFGYLNFPNFIDTQENLNISNERGGFIENSYYYRFLDIIYYYILFPAINIDIAVRNNKFRKDTKDNNHLDGNDPTSNDPIKKPEIQEGHKQKKDEAEGSVDRKKKQNNGSETGTTSKEKKELNTNKEEKKILRTSVLDVDEGSSVYLLDPTIISEEDITGKELIINPRNQMNIKDRVFEASNLPGEYYIDFFTGNIKETLCIKVKSRKIIKEKNKTRKFFQESNHFIGEVDLRGVNDLINQLDGLKYEEKYLLFVISFRAILEDLVKRHLHKRNISLKGNLKDNIVEMIRDMQQLLKTVKNDPLMEEKNLIKQKFKGNDALNNFLGGVNIKFENKDYAKFLHSLTHNPAKIQEDLALEIANDIILPLYILEKQLFDHKVI